MIRVTTFFLAILLSGTVLLAQTVEEARRDIYHGKYKTAKEKLNKIIAANGKDFQAIYWLGQATIEDEDNIAGAKLVYQNALNSGVNDPIIWVGMGHIELLEGKKDAARQRFEAAIANSLDKKKRENPNILNAIGRANADGPANSGDPSYAIEKLKRATELDPTNSDVFVNLGINYLKLGSDQGTNAYEAYTNAIRIEPNNAKAKFRLGKIFESQGNSEKFLQYYNDAIAADSLYTPVYYQLYNYYIDRNVNLAGGYLEKYIAYSDKDCRTDFLYAENFFRAGKYQESLNKAKAIEASSCGNYPPLKVLYAYNYDRLGDSLEAKSNIELYLANTPADKIKPAVFEFAGKLLLKFPGQETSATTYLGKAIESESVPANKVKNVYLIIETLGNRGKYDVQLEWYKKLSILTNGNLSKRDMYMYADASIKAKQYPTADSISRMYITKYPTENYGYLLSSKSAIAADKDTTLGSAVPAVVEYIKFMENTDKEKYKSQIISSYGYLVNVHANIMKDYTAAIKDLEGMLAVDPESTYAKSTIEQIKKVMNGTKKTGSPKK